VSESRYSAADDKEGTRPDYFEYTKKSEGPFVYLVMHRTLHRIRSPVAMDFLDEDQRPKDRGNFSWIRTPDSVMYVGHTCSEG
jgi:hypothetical protein